MPKCPVCNAVIEPLAETCNTCSHSWKLGQAECPATYEDTSGLTIAWCELEFGHTKRHRGTNVLMGDTEATISWFYPKTTKLAFGRSPDYVKRHGSAEQVLRGR